MKKLLLSFLTLSAVIFTANAQTEKGTWTLGGNVNFSSTKTDGIPKSNISFSVLPSLGYFIAHNIEVGTSVGYVYSKYYQNVAGGSGNVGSVKLTIFEVSPYIRAYKDITDQFKFFGQLSVPFSFEHTKYGDDISTNFIGTNDNHTIGVALSPGFAFFPAKKFGIEFSVNGISYNTLHYNDGSLNSNTKTFNIGANFFAPNLGVKFYL